MRQPIPLLGPEVYEDIEKRGLTTRCYTFADLDVTHEVFKSVVEAVKPSVIIEVGSFLGASAIIWAAVCKAKIYCVDHWIGGNDHIWAETEKENSVMRDKHGWPQLYYQFLHNIKNAGHQDRVVPVPFTTLDGARLLGEHGIMADVVYIDAGHDYPSCKADIMAYAPLLKPGGVMVGDDYHQHGVKQAVEEAFGGKARSESRGRFWYIQKSP